MTTENGSLDPLVEPLRSVREQFTILTEPHRPALWRYCLHLTGSPWDAEDLVQETMLRAFARLSGLWQPLANPRAYLFRVASNTWIDSLRRGRLPLDPLEEARDVPAGPEPDRVETAEALERLVALLPPRQRAVVLLVDVFGFGAREAGAMMGATEGAVRAALHRARTTLAGARAGEAQARPAADAGPVLARFVDAFNRRDAGAIVALLDAEAAADIVGVAEEHGRDVIRDQSLREEMEGTLPQRAELGHLAGEPVVLVYAQEPGRPEALRWMIRLGVVGQKICSWRSYFFTPELIRFAADALGVPAATSGYRYVAPELPA